MFLVDTSVWIEIFRKPSRFELGSVADLDEVVTCLPMTVPGAQIGPSLAEPFPSFTLKIPQQVVDFRGKLPA
jgi:hypothetical protein